MDPTVTFNDILLTASYLLLTGSNILSTGSNILFTGSYILFTGSNILFGITKIYHKSVPISHVLPFFWRVNHLRPAASDDWSKAKDGVRKKRLNDGNNNGQATHD